MSGPLVHTSSDKLSNSIDNEGRYDYEAVLKEFQDELSKISPKYPSVDNNTLEKKKSISSISALSKSKNDFSVHEEKSSKMSIDTHNQTDGDMLYESDNEHYDDEVFKSIDKGKGKDVKSKDNNDEDDNVPYEQSYEKDNETKKTITNPKNVKNLKESQQSKTNINQNTKNDKASIKGSLEKSINQAKDNKSQKSSRNNDNDDEDNVPYEESSIGKGSLKEKSVIGKNSDIQERSIDNNSKRSIKDDNSEKSGVKANGNQIEENVQNDIEDDNIPYEESMGKNSSQENHSKKSNSSKKSQTNNPNNNNSGDEYPQDNHDISHHSAENIIEESVKDQIYESKHSSTGSNKDKSVKYDDDFEEEAGQNQKADQVKALASTQDKKKGLQVSFAPDATIENKKPVQSNSRRPLTSQRPQSSKPVSGGSAGVNQKQPDLNSSQKQQQQRPQSALVSKAKGQQDEPKARPQKLSPIKNVPKVDNYMKEKQETKEKGLNNTGSRANRSEPNIRKDSKPKESTMNNSQKKRVNKNEDTKNDQNQNEQDEEEKPPKIERKVKPIPVVDPMEQTLKNIENARKYANLVRMEHKNKKSKDLASGDEEEGQEESDKKEGTLASVKLLTASQQKFRITKKVEHVDKIKNILDNHKNKQKKFEKMDDDIYLLLETGKLVKQDGSDEEDNNPQEQKWVGNGLGVTTSKKDNVGNTSKNPTKTAPIERAKKMLSTLEGKVKHQEPKFLKKAKEAKLANDEVNTMGFVQEDMAGGGDQALPEMGKTLEKPQMQTIKKGEQTDLEKTKNKNEWSYNTGEGVKTEKDKEKEAKEAEAKKRFTEIFKNEQQRKLDKMKEATKKHKLLLAKERENRKEKQKQLIPTNKALKKLENLNQNKNNVEEEEVNVDQMLKDKKEIDDLKKQYQLLLGQNEELNRNVRLLNMQNIKMEEEVNSLTLKKPVISLGKGNFTTLGQVPGPSVKLITESNLSTVSTLEQSDVFSIDDAMKNVTVDTLTPIEIIVNKIIGRGLTLEQVFHMLDSDGDGGLTLKEIGDNILKIGASISKKEADELIKLLDKNSDGIITLDEFIRNLQENLQVNKEYNEIMGQLEDISNPIILEERILDLKTRMKIVTENLETLKNNSAHEETEYSKLMKKLNKYEKFYAPMKKTKETGNMGKLYEDELRCKIEIEDLDDYKERLLTSHQQRISDIKNNIENIEEQIEFAIRRIINEKSRYEEKMNILQQQEIKNMFSQKIRNQIEDYLNQLQDEHELEDILYQRAILEQANAKINMDNKVEQIVMNAAATRIQKTYRGHKIRKEIKATKERILSAKLVISRAWKRYKLRKIRKKIANSLDHLLYKRLSWLWLILKGVRPKAKAELKEQKIEETKIENDQKTIKKEIIENLAISKQQANNKKLAKTKIKNLIWAITIIQRNVRNHKKTNYNPMLGVFDLIDGNLKNMQLCMLCNKEMVARICKSCETPFYCINCYADVHKTSTKRNHKFLVRKCDLTIQDYLKIQDLVLKYKKKLTELNKHFKDWDTDNAGVLDLALLKDSLRRKISEQKDVKELSDLAVQLGSATADDYSLNEKARMLIAKNPARVFIEYQRFLNVLIANAPNAF